MISRPAFWGSTSPVLPFSSGWNREVDSSFWEKSEGMTRAKPSSPFSTLSTASCRVLTSCQSKLPASLSSFATSSPVFTCLPDSSVAPRSDCTRAAETLSTRPYGFQLEYRYTPPYSRGTRVTASMTSLGSTPWEKRLSSVRARRKDVTVFS